MTGRIRTVKPEWLEDELLSALSSDARVLSIALLLLADDYGNGRASELYLAGRVFPGKPAETITLALRELCAMNYVALYTVSGQRYFSIRNWGKHQKVQHPGKPIVPMYGHSHESLMRLSGDSPETLMRSSGDSHETLHNPHETLSKSHETLTPDRRPTTDDHDQYQRPRPPRVHARVAAPDVVVGDSDLPDAESDPDPEPNPNPELDPGRETVCPTDLLVRLEKAGTVRQLAEKLAAPIESIRHEIKQFEGYWVVGKGMGQRRTNWAGKARQWVVEQHGKPGGLKPPGAVEHERRRAELGDQPTTRELAQSLLRRQL